VRMQASALHHTGVVGELAVLRVAMSSTVELVLGRSPGETSRVEVVSKLTTKFRKLEELCSWLDESGTKICSLLLGPPPGQARWADCLEEATEQLVVTLAERC
jgi:hypothetical protein